MFGRLLRTSSANFRSRSAERDLEADKITIGALKDSIETALTKLTAERDGLGRRMEDIVSRASLVVGNESDEYLSRDSRKSSALAKFESELINGQSRLAALDQNITNLKFIRAAFMTRFTSF